MKKMLTFSLLALTLTACNCKKNKQKSENENTVVSTNSQTTTTTEKSANNAGYSIGDEAVDFSLKNVNGENVSLSNYPNAKGFIVIFTCNHCPFAQAYEDRIIALNNTYAPKGFPVIAINPNDPSVQPEDSFEEMQKLAKAKNFSFPYLFDEEQVIYPQYGATKTPHVFVLNKEDGKNIVRYIGAIDDNYEDANAVKETYVADAVDALLEGKPVPTETTKAIGCSIKTQK